MRRQGLRGGLRLFGPREGKRCAELPPRSLPASRTKPKRHGRRAAILFGTIILAFAAVVCRLVDIMLVNHDWYLAKARMQQFKKEIFPVKRGVIVDRRGRELAVNLDTESVFCDPAGVVAPDRATNALAKAMNKRSDLVFAKLTKGGRFTWLERKLEIEEAQKIRAMKLEGIGFLTEAKRLYPKGPVAAHLIGFVDIDNKGLEGVERRYEKHLITHSESTTVLRDARGNILSEGVAKELKGNNLVLTVDEGLQHIVEKNLDTAMKEWRASSATAIMMDPHTGEILALANRPTFDLNNPGSASPHQRRNRAITDCYEPGSTFKIVVGTAALEERYIKPGMMFDCSAGSVEVGGRKIRDAHRHGVLTFNEVIQKSSNVGTIKIGLGLGKEKIYEYIKRFGFGDKTGIDLPGEVGAQVHPPERWSGMSIGAISIGQEVSVTPLQLLRAYAAIANGGMLVKPYVLSEVRSPEGALLYSAAPKGIRILSEKTATTFREILRSVTEEGGTAKGAAVEGNQVAGKTGTAQKIDPLTKRYSREKYVSSFVGFVPANDPKIALIVVIHEPKGQIYGGVVAAPVFKRIANETLSYLSVPRDDSDEKGLFLVAHR